MQDGLARQSSQSALYGALHDASAALLGHLGFPVGRDSKQLPNDLHHVGVCCKEVREASSAILEEFGQPPSGDFMRLPEELRRIRLKSAALANQALVHSVLKGFTLVHAHYEGINFEKMLVGFPDCYSAEDLDSFAAMAKGPAERFANALVPSMYTEGNPLNGADDDQAT